MEIKDKIELPLIDERIWQLFNILINTTPSVINGNMLEYCINDINIKLVWKPERKEDEFKPYTFVNPLEHPHISCSCLLWNSVVATLTPAVETGRIRFYIDTPYKVYEVRDLTFEEQYVYQKKLYEIYFNYDINYLNQFLPKSDLSGIDLNAPGYEQVLGYEQKIVEDSERVKKD